MAMPTACHAPSSATSSCLCACVCVCVCVWDVCVHTQTPDVYRYIVKKLDDVIKP